MNCKAIISGINTPNAIVGKTTESTAEPARFEPLDRINQGFSFKKPTASKDISHGSVEIIESMETTHYSIVDQYGKNKVVFYQIDLELTDLQTNEKVWIGDKKIKKAITN